jgi:hypothetical protein
VLAAAAFFFVPVFGARLAQHARIESWQRRGFGPDEPRIWWSHGFSRLSEAVRWRASGFAPQPAGAWKRMEFVAPDAKDWTERGFDPRTAAEWRREAFDAMAAGEWKGAGFSIGEAVSWRKRAFAAGEAAQWRAAGRSPLEAAAERDPSQVRWTR